MEIKELCARRNLGLTCDTPRALMQDVATHSELNIVPKMLDRLTDIRKRRVITAFHPEILAMLDALRTADHRLCMASNADVIDTLY